MEELLRNWRIWLLFIAIFGCMGILLFKGISFGIDFEGGTLFQVFLDKPLSDPSELQRVSNVIEQRLNVTGLKDIKVSSWGNQVIVAQVPAVEAAEVERLESLLRKQGRFEVTLDGNVIFTGADILGVDSGTRGVPAVQGTSWSLPFDLKTTAALRFRDMAFHRCTLLSLSGGGSTASQDNYECSLTYFFIDRPSDSVLVLSQSRYDEDKALFSAGSARQNIPAGSDLGEVLENTAAPFFTVQGDLTPAQESQLQSLRAGHNVAILSPDLNSSVQESLKQMGFVVKVPSVSAEAPWLWSVSGLRSIVRLQPSITGNLPYAEHPEQLQALTSLIITGGSVSEEDALRERSETKVLLQSGSLPVSVDSISKETISPFLGENFKSNALLIGALILLGVSLIIFIRYHNPFLSGAILFTAMVEVLLTISFTSLFGSIDLAAMTGILAVVGTGVDNQIIITDELLAGGSLKTESSRVARIKRAFFIIIASVATMAATMLPIILFGSSMVKLVGFAVATLVGAIAGILITRPAFAELAKSILSE